MRSIVACVALLLAGTPAWASRICVVNFEKTVGETHEGKAALARLKTLETTKQEQLVRMRTELTSAVADLQKRRSLLPKNQIETEEAQLRAQQAAFEDTFARFQKEFQVTYDETLEDLDQKIRTIAAEAAKASQCTILLDSAVVVYQASEVTDISPALVARYNKAHPRP